MGARREVVSAVTESYRSAKRAEKGRILDALCATTGWHRKRAVRALRQRETATVLGQEAPRARRRRYGATIKDALMALWEASDRVCGKRLKVMIPTLLPALERNDRLKLDTADRDRVLAISAASIDRQLGEVKLAGQIRPDTKEVVYGVEIKRVMRSKLVLGIADGWLKADGELVYQASDLKVALFKETTPQPAGA